MGSTVGDRTGCLCTAAALGLLAVALVPSGARAADDGCTATCHQGLREGKVVHPLTAEGACTSCHKGMAASGTAACGSGMVFDLKGKDRKVCVTCHEL